MRRDWVPAVPPALLVVALLGFPSRAQPQPGTASPAIRPCSAGTAAHGEAEADLGAVDRAIRELTPSQDPAPVLARLARLVAGPCFAILEAGVPQTKTGVALTTWWKNGGRFYLARALHLDGKEAVAWIAPDIRRSLTRETAPGHALAPLLCPAFDETCGRETSGWAMRAESVLEMGARLRQARGEGHSLDGWTRDRPPRSEDCQDHARAGAAAEGFMRYRRCLDVTAIRRQAFPIGRIQAPGSGWLVVRGRRGHHGFCEELRVFDLATGSTYDVATCSHLALNPDGTVDRQATDARRQVESKRGMVALAALREAAWMMLLLGEMDRDVHVRGFGVGVPDGIVVELPKPSTLRGGSIRMSRSHSTGDTKLGWEVVDMGRRLGMGTLTWPSNQNDDAEAYAATLLAATEATFTAGCPSAKPPAETARQLRGLSGHSLDANRLREADEKLRRAWTDIVDRPCGKQDRP